jgi:hypothetical protein
MMIVDNDVTFAATDGQQHNPGVSVRPKDCAAGFLPRKERKDCHER